jgi:hypothetical protein
VTRIRNGRPEFKSLQVEVICVFYKTSIIALGPISPISNRIGSYFSGGKAASALVLEASYPLHLVLMLRKSGVVIHTRLYDLCGEMFTLVQYI